MRLRRHRNLARRSVRPRGGPARRRVDDPRAGDPNVQTAAGEVAAVQVPQVGLAGVAQDRAAPVRAVALAQARVRRRRREVQRLAVGSHVADVAHALAGAAALAQQPAVLGAAAGGGRRGWCCCWH